MKDKLIDGIIDTVKNIKETRPLIHVIPNNVSARFCADGLSAIGARPVMASSFEETGEITAQADSAVYNMGQPSADKIIAVKNAILSAMENDKQIVFDPVGIGASAYRKKEITSLLNMKWKGIIKGNIDEIECIINDSLSYNGVDSKVKLLSKDIKYKIREYKKPDKIIAITGVIDYIFSTEYVISIKHKSDRIRNVTGMGCLAGSLCGAMLSVTDKLTAAAGGLGIMSYCSNKAEEKSKGYGSFQIELLDCMENLLDNELKAYLQEVIIIEN